MELKKKGSYWRSQSDKDQAKRYDKLEGISVMHPKGSQCSLHVLFYISLLCCWVIPISNFSFPVLSFIEEWKCEYMGVGCVSLGIKGGLPVKMM